MRTDTYDERMTFMRTDADDERRTRLGRSDLHMLSERGGLLPDGADKEGEGELARTPQAVWARQIHADTALTKREEIALDSTSCPDPCGHSANDGGEETSLESTGRPSKAYLCGNTALTMRGEP
jgi:hypothetical protein